MEHWVMSKEEVKFFLRQNDLVCKVWSLYPDYYDILEKYFIEAKYLTEFEERRLLKKHLRLIQNLAEERFVLIVEGAINAAVELEEIIYTETKEETTVHVIEVYPYIERRTYRIKKKPRGRKGKPWYFVRRQTKIINIEDSGVVVAVKRKFKEILYREIERLKEKYLR